MVTVGDNPDRIADVVRGSVERADVVITTGGLGPTIDDPTREAIAQAFSITTIFHPDYGIKFNFVFARARFQFQKTISVRPIFRKVLFQFPMPWEPLQASFSKPNHHAL